MVIKERRSLSSDLPEVKWIGTQNSKAAIPPHLAHKSVRFYDKCIFGPQTLSVGDYVLVSNIDAAEPDTVAGCDVARILQLFELQEMTNKDICRAIVQWYSRPQCVPPKAFQQNKDINIDPEYEIVEEHRPFDADISIETIFRKCSVIYGDPEQSAIELLERVDISKRNRCPMFVCRYKFIKVKRSYRLVPLQFISEEGVVAENATAERPQRRKSCHQETPSAATVTTPTSASSCTKRASKRQAAFVGERKRRASSTAEQVLEFIDMNYFRCENKVSPIKIVGGRSVVRLSASTKKPNDEINANYLISSPLTEKNVILTPTSRAATARRNLNLSLDKEMDSTAGSDYINYSIVNTPKDAQQSPNDIKIKLRISERRRSTRLVSKEQELDPLNIEKCAATLVTDYQRKKLGIVDTNTPNSNDLYHTPSKRSKECTEMTPPTKRRSILKSATRRADDNTPRRSIQLSNIVEKRVFQENEIIATPKRSKPKNSLRVRENEMDEEYIPTKKPTATPSTPSRRGRRKSACEPISPTQSQPTTPSQKLKLIRAGDISPSIVKRQSASRAGHKSELQRAREQLHVSVVPQSLPCREQEFSNIYNFLLGKIEDQCGGCMYVSGVPGTGKTATVSGVIRMLQSQAKEEEVPAFDFLEINGMRLTEPRQAYVQIYKQLTGKTVSWEQAHSLLEKRFSTPAPRRVTTVLLVDELDILCNRRQDVVYNLLDWPTKSAARLVVITIANTMDLPERLLLGKVTSRLGLTRLTFQPYTHKQLQDIVTARLNGSEAFKGDAVQLVARKVAAVSGDARRALDICRRATEIADNVTSAGTKEVAPVVTMSHVQQALSEMIASAKVQAIKNCSRIEQIFLQAVVAEVTRTGVEETSFMGVYTQLETIAAFLGATVPTPGRAFRICAKLGAERLLICEHSRNDIFQKILLNVSTDDVHYALRINNTNTNAA